MHNNLISPIPDIPILREISGTRTKRILWPVCF